MLDSSGSDPEGPPANEEQTKYLNDVCVTTALAIGDNIGKESGELPGDGGDDAGGSTTTPAPTVPIDEVVEADGSGSSSSTDNNREVADNGLSGGAWAGIAIAGAAVGTMLLYLLVRKEGDESEVELDENADDLDLRKERNAKNSLGVETNHNNRNGNGEEDGGGPISPTSTMDATQSMTADAHSDVSSLPSTIGMSQSQESSEADDTGYNGLNLLPGLRNDEESILSGDEEENYFYSGVVGGEQQQQQQRRVEGNKSSSLAAMGVASGAIVGMG